MSSSVVTIPYPLTSDVSGIVVYTKPNTLPQPDTSYNLQDSTNANVSDAFHYVDKNRIDMESFDPVSGSFYNAMIDSINNDSTNIANNANNHDTNVLPFHSITSSSFTLSENTTIDDDGFIYIIGTLTYVIKLNYTRTEYYTPIYDDFGNFLDNGPPSYYAGTTEPRTENNLNDQFIDTLNTYSVLFKVDQYYGKIQYLFNFKNELEYKDPTRIFYKKVGIVENIYALVNDNQKTMVLKIALVDGSVTTIYDDTTTPPKGPFGMAMDSNGNLYIAENYGRILKINPTTTPVTSNIYASFEYNPSLYGYADSITLRKHSGRPQSLTFDKDNNLYVCDNGSSFVQYYNNTSNPYKSISCIIKIPYNSGTTTVNYSPAVKNFVTSVIVTNDAIITDDVNNYCLTFNMAVDDSNHLYIKPDTNSDLYKINLSSPVFDTIVVTGDIGTLIHDKYYNIYYNKQLSRIATKSFTFTHVYIADYQGFDSATLSLNDGSTNLDTNIVVYNNTDNILSNDTSLSTFTINGTAVTNGGIFNVANGTTSVTLLATPTNNAASVSDISGVSGLITGNNTLTFRVTAQDSTTQDYSVTIVVAAALSSDKSLSTFTINSINVINDTSLNVPYGTTSVILVATPTNNAASVSDISGVSGLITGNNTLTFRVTAQDSTQQNYSFSIVVAAPSSDKSLSTFTINGTAVTNGGIFNVANGTTSVTVVATKTNANATVGTISGNSGLITGNNTLTFRVTAQDSTTQDYSVTIVVAEPNGPSSDTSLSTFTINGRAVTNGGTIHFPYGTTSVTVVATKTNANATVDTITGDSGLIQGDNSLTFTVTAEDSTVENYSVTIVVDEISPTSNIACFKEGTKILCLINDEESYVPIQEIRKGYLIKTALNGYLPVDMIGKSYIYNPSNSLRSKNRLYVCSPNKYPELSEDLILTGCHSILVDNISDEQREKTMELLNDIFITDQKYRLLTCLDERASTCNEVGLHEIWHLALENTDYYMNFGIYANGLLVETCSKRMMKEYSGMELIE